jgi:hypothetical protein
LRQVAQPSHLPHRDAGAAPLDRLAHDNPSSSVIVTLPERGQHDDRQALKPAFPLGTFFAAYCLASQRRASPRLSTAY